MRLGRLLPLLPLATILIALVAAATPEDLQVLRIPGGVYSGSRAALPRYDDVEKQTLWTILTPEPVIGDLNGDGSVDLALPVVDAEMGEDGQLARLDGGILLCLNDGTGAFTRFAALAETDVYPSDIALADMNGDGHLDVIGLRPTRSLLVTWFGDGEGGFQIGMETPVDSSYFALEVADVNGDSALDVVVFFNHTADVPLIREIHVFPGAGDGSLGTPIVTTFPEDHVLMYGKPWRVQIADLTGDGHLDAALVGTTYSGGSGIILARGNGAGRFDAGLETAGFDFYARHTATGDFDGDGHADLVISHLFDGEDMRANPDNYGESSQATILFGGRLFLTERLVVELEVPALVIRTSDLNMDSKCDLVSIGQYGAFSVALASPVRTFGEASLYSGGGGLVWTGFVGDFDGNGEQDVGVQILDSGLYISLGDGSAGLGSGWLSPPLMSLVPSFRDLSQVVEDLNRDGNLDLVCIDSEAPGVAYGDGSGKFPRYEAFSDGPASIHAVAAADANHDGLTDLILGGVSDGRTPLHFALNNDRGGFVIVPISIDQPISEISDVVAADLDGDGSVEVIVSGGESGLWLIRDLNSSLVNGAQVELLEEGDERDVISHLRATDLDDDDVLDLVYVSLIGFQGTTVVMQGRGDATFEERARIPGALQEIADLDANGLLDISTSAGVFLSKGSLQYSLADLGRDVYSASNLDSDGVPELITAFGRTLIVSRSSPEGGWMQKVDFAVTNGVARILDTTPVYADFNGDSRTDVSLCTESGIAVLINRLGVDGE